MASLHEPNEKEASVVKVTLTNGSYYTCAGVVKVDDTFSTLQGVLNETPDGSPVDMPIATALIATQELLADAGANDGAGASLDFDKPSEVPSGDEPTAA